MADSMHAGERRREGLLPHGVLVVALAIAAVVVAVSLTTLSLTPRLIRREKMLP